MLRTLGLGHDEPLDRAQVAWHEAGVAGARDPRGSSTHAALAGQLCDPVVPGDGY